MAESLRAWGLVSTHGAGSKRLMAALREGRSEPTELSQERWPVPANGRSLAFYAGARPDSVRLFLVSNLRRAWSEASEMLTDEERSAVLSDCALIFSSTKGCVEDYIWNSASGDPYTPVVEDFLRQTALKPKQWLTVSNACASSHSSLELARGWLRRGVAKNVVVIAADFVGPFVLQGFHALHALSATTIRPFDQHRDGLLLGEAAAAVILSSTDSTGEGDLLLSGTTVDCEGFAVTRPESTAASLRRAIAGALQGKTPDAVISHGTATQANDQAEDRAFSSELPSRPWVSASKWSVGHTLGASGLVDLIAAAEWLRGQSPFAIGTCERVDPVFSSRVLTKETMKSLPSRSWNSILVTALGFGGVHSAFLLEKR